MLLFRDIPPFAVQCSHKVREGYEWVTKQEASTLNPCKGKDDKGQQRTRSYTWRTCDQGGICPGVQRRCLPTKGEKEPRTGVCYQWQRMLHWSADKVRMDVHRPYQATFKCRKTYKSRTSHRSNPDPVPTSQSLWQVAGMVHCSKRPVSWGGAHIWLWICSRRHWLAHEDTKCEDNHYCL